MIFFDQIISIIFLNPLRDIVSEVDAIHFYICVSCM